jgi:hypothetical protein
MKIFKNSLCLFLMISLIWIQGTFTFQASAADQLTETAGFIFNPFWGPDWIGESDLGGAMYGASVASAGDVNGDGFADVIVGAPYFRNGQDREGRAYVYHGSATGVRQLPAWVFESNLIECELGWSVASAGDVNGDGYDDVLVASEFCSPSPETENREGRVYLFLGSPSGLSATYAWMMQGEGFDEGVGWSIDSAGDVNGDGFADVIIGAPWASYDEGHEGRAYVFYGSSSGLSPTADWIEESNVPWTDLGSAVASAGDVNGDGYDDVIIGHIGMSNPEEREGRVYLYYGSASGLPALPAWSFENNVAGSNLGEAVASAGDVNGDGFSDVLVGGFIYSRHDPENREGVAYLFLGSASGPSLTPDWTLEGDQDYGELGQSVASAGDVNADGYDDVLIGAPWYSRGEAYEGVAFLFYGSPTGLRSSPVHIAESNQEGANLGYSVASAGDVNGDGIDDIILGAQNYDGGQENEGRAMVFHGRADAENVLFIPILAR